MTNKKPEWFEIADNEVPVRDFTSTRRLPIWILSFALIFVGAGSVVSTIRESSPAVSSEVILSQESQSSSLKSNVANKAVPQNSSAPSVSTSSAVGAKMLTPSIGQLPTGGDDEDGDDEDGDDEDGDDD